MIFKTFSRRGMILILGTSLAFLITAIFLASTTTTFQQQPPGVQAFTILDDLSIAGKTTFYVEQAFRNAAFHSYRALSTDSFFPNTLGGKSCPLLNEKPVLFSSSSCLFTEKDFENFFTERLQKTLASYFNSSLYGMKFTASDFPFTLNRKDQSLVLSGHSTSSFSYTGKEVAYDFFVPYHTTLPFSFSFLTDTLSSFQRQIPCISSLVTEENLLGDSQGFVYTSEGMSFQSLTFSQTLQESCSFSDHYLWSFEKQGAVVFVTVQVKNKPSFLETLSFTFAITLNNLQDPTSSSTLFGG
ncbi:MAG TPA: hypothetical protein VJH37_00030 [Candidatus Nanoarchaeia archaeon]|nr:hypothetical protein [Candidatus Nanoarchaeia archaeon]